MVRHFPCVLKEVKYVIQCNKAHTRKDNKKREKEGGKNI